MRTGCSAKSCVLTRARLLPEGCPLAGVRSDDVSGYLAGRKGLVVEDQCGCGALHARPLATLDFVDERRKADDSVVFQQERRRAGFARSGIQKIRKRRPQAVGAI